MGIMKEKYQRTLNYLLAIPKDDSGLFKVNARFAAEELGLTISTFNRHIKKLLEEHSMTIIYKGGTLLAKVCKDIIIDADRYNDGQWQPRRDPNNFQSTIYSINKCTQYQRDIAILSNVLEWQDKYIRHYIAWANAENLEYDENLNGMSETTLKLLEQFVKYMIKGRFGYCDESYNEYMNTFESLENAHGILK